MQAAESNAQTNLSKKRDILLELREARQEKSEAKRFQLLKDDLVRENENFSNNLKT